MGGMCSGRGQRGKGTTSDMQALDIRRLHWAGLLTPGRAFSWQWSVCGKEVASIQMRTEVDRVVLDYRNRSNGGEWQPMDYPVIWNGPTAPWVAGGRGSSVRRKGVGGAWRFCSAGQCSPAGTVTSWPMRANGKRKMTVSCRRADTIRLRLGWGAGMANPDGGKPNGMHWRTYQRLKAEHDAFANALWVGMADRLGLVNRRLDKLGLDLLDDLGRDG